MLLVVERSLPWGKLEESAVGVLEGGRQLGVQELVPSDAVLVEGGSLLEAGAEGAQDMQGRERANIRSRVIPNSLTLSLRCNLPPRPDNVGVEKLLCVFAALPVTFSSALGGLGASCQRPRRPARKLP